MDVGNDTQKHFLNKRKERRTKKFGMKKKYSFIDGMFSVRLKLRSYCYVGEVILNFYKQYFKNHSLYSLFNMRIDDQTVIFELWSPVILQ